MEKRALQPVFTRILALVSLCVVLIVFLAGPIHKHASAQEVCLICHVSNHSNAVAIDHGAGKPLIAVSYRAAILARVTVDLDAPPSIRTPRAPPSSLLPL